MCSIAGITFCKLSPVVLTFTMFKQALQLDASPSVDDDGLDEIPFEFSWYCDTESGGVCVSQMGQNLDETLIMNETMLAIPAGYLPIGKLLPHVGCTLGSFCGGRPHWLLN